MASKIKDAIVIQCFLCSLLSVFMVGRAVDSDISCLRSIKESLEDPFSHLSQWNFNNTSEGYICDFPGVECWNKNENRVLSIKLSNMGLKGEFPRGLRNCSSLQALNLSSNDLTGPIPSDIFTFLPFVTTIDLSYNKFSGEIPATFANCTYLNILRLDNNMLSGHIPQELAQLQRIKLISFSNNRLSGPVPLFPPGLVSADDFANNRIKLCGEPLPPCRSSDFPRSFKQGLVVGYVFSVTVTMVILHYMSYCAPWQQSKQKRNKAKEFCNHICSIAARKAHNLLLLKSEEKAIKEIAAVTERMKSTITFNEVREATDNFSIDNAIGIGEIGIMYEGRLLNRWHLAVKRVLSGSKQFKKKFLLEIRILGKYKHTNIVPLLGFGVEGRERILVYQYMSNGRLSKWLCPLESEVQLKWPQRIKIALGVARGLSWLHHTCDLHVVHLNISSACVLLDKNFEPKISNFGHAKFMNPGPNTMFYACDGKKDVYDFGSLLLELITGKTFKELCGSSNATFNLSGNPSIFYNAIDKFLTGEGFENEVYSLIKVACKCVRPFPDERPTMLEVYNNMIDIWGNDVNSVMVPAHSTCLFLLQLRTKLLRHRRHQRAYSSPQF